MVGFVNLFIGEALIWLSNSALLLFLGCWPSAPSSVGVFDGTYQVVGFNMMGKVVLLGFVSYLALKRL